ncbi:MAG TPA: WGR domain-containing protein [Rhodopila sp.]
MAAEPSQLPLFPESVALTRIRPDRNEWRFYRIEVCPLPAIPSGFAERNLDPAPPDLFGRALLVRHWGRIGTQGRRRLDAHPDAGAAANALAAMLRVKRRRGYQDRSV